MPVYLIDDDKSITRSLSFLLSTLKIETRSFKSGEDFLNQVATLIPGCIILDVDLGSMNGIEVHEQLVRRGVTWPVVFLTGECSIPLMVSALQRGAVEFVIKPSTEKGVIEAVHKASLILRDAA